MKSFSLTDVGQVRSQNQDYVYASEQPIGNLPNLFVLADGWNLVIRELVETFY